MMSSDYFGPFNYSIVDNVHEFLRNKILSRFIQGLGEMMATQLWDTTMNPQTRTLKLVTMEVGIQHEFIRSNKDCHPFYHLIILLC